MFLGEVANRYDTFISYSRPDRSWAEKLFVDLDQMGIKSFFDRSRLQAGTSWDRQVLEGLSSSRGIVVLWSENAAQSHWVRRECGYFDALISDPTLTQEASNRRMIFLLLEGEPKAYGSLQMITDLKDVGAYTDPIDHVDPYLWRRVLDKVADAVRSANTIISVPVAVLTMTHEEFVQLDPSYGTYRFRDSLREIFADTEISKDDLERCYGPRRMDWRPYRSQLSVESMLYQIQDDINENLGKKNLWDERRSGVILRWEPIGENFWSNDYDDFQSVLRKLKTDLLSVVIVDPLAFYIPDMQTRFHSLIAELKNTNVLFMTLLPPVHFGIAHYNFRRLIRQAASPMFGRMYEAKFSRRGFADDEWNRDVEWYCDVDIDNRVDFKGTLDVVLNPLLIKQRVFKVLRQG